MKRDSTKEWSAVVWLRTTMIPQFGNLCNPVSFDFMSTRDLIREVKEDPEQRSNRQHSMRTELTHPGSTEL